MRVKPLVKVRARRAVPMRPVRATARVAALPALAARQVFVPPAVHLALAVERRSPPRLDRACSSKSRLQLPQQPPQHSGHPPGEAMRMQAIEAWRSRLAVVRMARGTRAYFRPIRQRQVGMICYGPAAARARRGCASSTSPRPWREFAPARSTVRVRCVRQFPSPCRRVRHRPASSAPCPRTS